MIKEHTYLVTLYTPVAVLGRGNFVTIYVTVPVKYYEDEEFLNLIRDMATATLQAHSDALPPDDSPFTVVNIIDATVLKPIKEN